MVTDVSQAAIALPLICDDDRNRVGPNAITQTSRALTALVGFEMRNRVFAHAGLGWMGNREPDQRVRAETVNALNASVLAVLGRQTAELVLGEAGVRTGHYIIDNRIPGLAKTLLRLLPRRLALRLLLMAVARNAWTFAGDATVETGRDWIVIQDNPICLGKAGFSGCVWHHRVLETLFHTLVSPDVTVVETHCIGQGDPFCRFEFRLAKAA